MSSLHMPPCLKHVLALLSEIFCTFWLTMAKDGRCQSMMFLIHTHTHTTRLIALFPGLPRSAGTRKVKPIWILLKQKTVSGRGISWAICKSASHSRQITMPVPHHSNFYRPDALPAAQPTASKHWRQLVSSINNNNYNHRQSIILRARRL